MLSFIFYSLNLLKDNNKNKSYKVYWEFILMGEILYKEKFRKLFPDFYLYRR
jgi:hypothetical protein